MERTLRHAALWPIALLCLSVGTARADLIVGTFSGTVSSLDDPDSIVPGVVVGTTLFSGSFSYDSTHPFDSGPGGDGIFEYRFDPPGNFSFVVTVGGETFNIAPLNVPLIDIGDNLADIDFGDIPPTFGDLFSMVQDSISASFVANVALQLVDATGLVFSQADQLPTILDGDSFGIKRIVITGSSLDFESEFRLVGDLQSLTASAGAAVAPEPSSMTLFAIGIVAFLGRAIRRQRGQRST
jgi:hypothetical protein